MQLIRPAPWNVLALLLLAVLSTGIWYFGITKQVSPAPLIYSDVHGRVFVSAITGELTATVVGKATILEDDVLLRINGAARTIRAVRLPINPKSEDDYKQLLPIALSELTASPFTVRVTDLEKDFPQQDAFELTFVFEKAGDQVYRFPIRTVEEIRKSLPKQTPSN